MKNSTVMMLIAVILSVIRNCILQPDGRRKQSGTNL